MKTQRISRIGLGGLAAAGAAALVLGLAAAPATAKVTADGTPLANVTAAVPSKITRPTTSTPVKKNVTVRFDGPDLKGNDYYQLGYKNDAPKVSATLVRKNAGARGALVIPEFGYSANQKLDPQKGVNSPGITVRQSTTLGKYALTIPVSQYVNNTWVAQKTTTRYFYVNADPKVSREKTYFKGSGKRHRTYTVRASAPRWQTNAKVRVYFKASGRTSYKRVGYGYLKLRTTTATRSKVTIRVSKKYNLKGKGGRYFLKVYSKTGAPGYRTATRTITRTSDIAELRTSCAGGPAYPGGSARYPRSRLRHRSPASTAPPG